MTFLSYFRKHLIPKKSALALAVRRPLTWQGLFFVLLASALIGTLYVAILSVNNRYLYTIPARGGTLTEGMIGAPHMINPLLASTPTDTQLVSLLFSGLMKYDENGALVPDLAQKYEVSPDGLEYTFTLRDDLSWSDGTPLTSADIAFTIARRADTQANSVWQHVQVLPSSATSLVFKLYTPQEDFLSYTTLGILPMHIWNGVPIEEFENSSYNLHPVGSGPFRFAHLTEKNGIVEEIRLTRNPHYVGAKTYIRRYVAHFYANQQDLVRALLSGSIAVTGDATAETAQLAPSSYVVSHVSTGRIIGLFETKQTSIFPSAVITILNGAIDKAHILDTITYGYGTLLDARQLSLDEARNALQSLGYTISADGTLEKHGTPIQLSIAVENDPRILAIAHAFVLQLQELGITSVVKAFDPGRFQDVIQQNQYQLFFGAIPQDDIPSGYHSIIPLYTQSIPLIHDPDVHIYTVPGNGSVWYRSEHTWYMRTDKVWKPFTT